MRANGKDVAAVILGVVTFVAWGAFTRGPYHFDDFVTPLADPASQGLGSFFAHMGVTLRPLTKLTYAIEASLGLTDRPWARRLVSCAVHGFGAALLSQIVAHAQRMHRGAESRALTWLLVLAYALHPIHAEAVLQLSGRPALLGATLLFGAIHCAQRERDHLAGILFFAACMARETAIAGLLPLVVVVLPFGLRGRLSRALPLLAGLFLAVPVFLHNARMAELAAFSRAMVSEEGSPLARQWAAIPVGISLWLRPYALSVDHGEVLPGSPMAPLCLVGLGVLASSVLVPLAAFMRPAGRLGRSSLGLAAALFFAALAPTQSFVAKLDPLTERPFAFALACVPVALVALPRWHFVALPRWHFVARSARASRLLPIAVALGACVWAARSLVVRAPVYADEVSLWADAAAKSQTNVRPYQNWVVSLEEAGRHADALAALRVAREKFPWDRGLRLTEETYRETREPK